MGLYKCDVEDFGELRGRVSSESDTQWVRRGEQITALRILKWRRDDAAGNTPPVEISVLAQGDRAAMSTFLLIRSTQQYNNTTAAGAYISSCL